MIKFPQDFWHINGKAKNTDIQKDVKAMQKHLRKLAKAGKADYQFIEGRYLVIGLTNEQGERTIFVAKDFYSIDYLPDEGWMKWGENNESSDSL